MGMLGGQRCLAMATAICAIYRHYASRRYREIGLDSSAIALDRERLAFSSMGRKIEKVVPCFTDPVQLFIWIVPPCFSIIFCVIHRPSPVPKSAFVVKNGWKRLCMSCAAIPEPVSRMVTRNG